MKHVKLKWKDYVVIVIITTITYLFSAFTAKTGLLQGGITSINTYNDSRFSDYYTQVIRSGESESQSHSITIISLQDCLNRKTIARLINIIDSLQPKAIGFDVLLEGQMENDTVLIESLINCKNIVLARRMVKDSLASYPIYDCLKEKTIGVANFEGHNLLDKIRHFKTLFLLPNGDTLNSFSSAIVKQIDSEAYKRLLERSDEIEIINYHRLIHFPCVKWDEIINEDGRCIIKDDKNICDRIVLVGLDSDDASEVSPINEDVHITPINEVWTGTRIHAAAIDTILKEDYVHTVSPVFVNFIAIIVLFIWVWYLYKSKKNINSFKVLLNRITQILLILIVFFIGILCFKKNEYLDFSIITIGMGVSAICFDIVYSIYSIIINNKTNKLS